MVFISWITSVIIWLSGYRVVCLNIVIAIILVAILKRIIIGKDISKNGQDLKKGIAYEYKVARYLRKRGFWNIRVTQASGDYGADIVARKGMFGKYVIQCKYYQNPVGVSAVQEVVASKAVYRCNRAMVVTNSTYTKSAEKLAKDNNVILLSKIRK